MKRSRPVATLALLALVGCSGVTEEGISTDSPTEDSKKDDTQDFFAKDPPPQYCGPATNAPPQPPGGTPDCPADKNREGCPCTQAGKTAPCWPGLRANRNHGACRDGVTTCKLIGELDARWGRCEGYVLPKQGAAGPEACRCFSKGRWEIDNLIKCMVTSSDGKTIYAVSTKLVGGEARCPDQHAFPPAPDLGTVWSPNRITVDCAGQFKLCLAIKTGDRTKPLPSDCVVARVCIDVWYPTANQTQELPPLPSWSTTDAACSTKHAQIGGYAEMSVEGKSIECDDVGDGGAPRVFHRRGYCPSACSKVPTPPGCGACGADGQDQGDF